ncbi:hypothetical protein LPH43_05645 [Xylella taiwanensis]|uniref:hypothetical protein n=1 Tax=Xylella taiwanensis TaxID=1444770 RepID=UPI0004AE5BC6|nr:hypothetical protein [Xylella taiwanensis]UFN03280.1 hypothetical protein LPH43_05645 [Xylella taiwanensis]UFN19182.1 hypothetical protein LPH64_05575 [Xylella taiwanensis]UFN28171.1 hypothetical protein LPH51_05655 [Xylella taiwanensis]
MNEQGVIAALFSSSSRKLKIAPLDVCLDALPLPSVLDPAWQGASILKISTAYTLLHS